MKGVPVGSRVKVSADGRGVVSHAGTGLLREIADLTGLSEQVTVVLADTYRGRWVYAPGAVFAVGGAGCRRVHVSGDLGNSRRHEQLPGVAFYTTLGGRRCPLTSLSISATECTWTARAD